MSTSQLLVRGMEQEPGINQGGLLRPKTVGTAEAPLEVPLLTPEDLEFMLQVEADLFGPRDETVAPDDLIEAESALTPEDLEFMLQVEAELFGDSAETESAPKAGELNSHGRLPRAVRHERRRFGVGRRIGGLALSATILVGTLVVGVVGVTAAQSALGKDAPVAQSADRPNVEVTQPSQAQAVELEDQAAPQTTTTSEATTPPKPFEAKAGQVIGSFEIPKTCIDIQLVEVDSSEMALIGETVKQGLPNGQIKADYLIPDPTPVEDCAPVDEYARNHPGFVQRLDSTKASAVGSGNPGGKTSFWQPIAVHENNGGHPTSAYPGQVGLTMLWGHRVTRSAPNMDVEVLEAGDPAFSHRADGKQTGYVFKERLLLSPDNIETQLRDYYNRTVLESVAHGGTQDVQMVALGGCADDSGNGGGDSMRVVSIFVGA